jgi:NAD(P)-dependent dehydrogenase (short-subunit alcohol dehydrogenase family)
VINDLDSKTDGRDRGVSIVEGVAAAIREAGGIAVASRANVATVAGAESILSTALDAFGRIDIVVNNAGILTYEPDFASLDPQELESHLSVHVLGSFNVTRAAWPHMVTAGYGRVVMTSSSGLLGQVGLISYGTAKGAVLGLARSLALAGADHDIKVNTLFPGAPTRMSDLYASGRRTSGTRFEHDVRGNWWPRLAAHVSPLVAYLVHEDCSASGEIYTAMGGSVSRVFFADTRGYANLDLTPEDVRDHWSTINEPTGSRPLTDSASWSARAEHRVRPLLGESEYTRSVKEDDRRSRGPA